MVNINGSIVEHSSHHLSLDNRGYAFGDALFETIKTKDGKPLFWEDHYFRLMSSMRILRMEIPMTFTMEFLEEEISKTLQANDLMNGGARARLNVHRLEGGKYLPNSMDVEYNIRVKILPSAAFEIQKTEYTVELYKDFMVTRQLLSNLKTNNKIINVLGSIFANENGYDNCLILNTDKQVVEALQGNIFLVKDSVIKTPPLSDGCLKGIMRKQLLEISKNLEGFEVKEESISPFELQQADELFISNSIMGIQPITSYRKKEYNTVVATQLLKILNESIGLD